MFRTIARVEIDYCPRDVLPLHVYEVEACACCRNFGEFLLYYFGALSFPFETFLIHAFGTESIELGKLEFACLKGAFEL